MMRCSGLFLLCSLLCAPLSAGKWSPTCCCEPPLYILVGFNQSGVICRENDASSGFAQTRYAIGGHIFFGTELFSCLAVEAGYTYLGTTRINPDVGYQRRETWALPLRFHYVQPMLSCLDVHLLGGAQLYEDRFSFRTPESSRPPTNNQWGVGYHFGFGLEFFWCEIGYRLGITHWDFNDPHTRKTLLEIGIRLDI